MIRHREGCGRPPLLVRTRTAHPCIVCPECGRSVTVLEPFPTWIRASPGRCPACGRHPPTQGHAPGCPKPRPNPTNKPNRKAQP